MARQRGSRWQADVRTPAGERLRPTFGTEREALVWEKEARAAIKEGRPIPEAASGMAGKRDLSTLGSLFDHVSRTHWAGMKSAEGLTRNGKEVVDYFGRNRRLDDITSADVDEFAVSLADRGKAKATVNRKLSALSKMMKIAGRAGAVDRAPAMPWKKELKTRFRFLDDTEERTLLAYWLAVRDQDQHDLCVLLLDTGARAFSEMIPISWDDCSGRVATFWNTKTNRPRSVPLTKRSRQILDRRKRERPNSKGPFQGFNKNTMRGRWDRMRQTLGFGDVTPHTLRHTCASRLVLGGADPKRVMEWLGHTNLETTMRYLQMRPDALHDILHILEKEAA